MNNITKSQLDWKEHLLPGYKELVESGGLTLDVAIQQAIIFAKAKLTEAGIDFDRIRTRPEKCGDRYYINIGRKLQRAHKCPSQFSSMNLDELILRMYLDIIIGKTLTLEEAFEQYLTFKHKELHAGHKTIKYYRGVWNTTYKDSVLAKMPINSITKKDISDFFIEQGAAIL